MVYTSVANDSDRHAGHQGGRERGFLAQIGSSLTTILAVTPSKELFVTVIPLKPTLNINKRLFSLPNCSVTNARRIYRWWRHKWRSCTHFLSVLVDFG